MLVGESYRVKGTAGIYSIGDCARIVDPRTSKADQMTCKEGGIQADRLGKIVTADHEGRTVPVHKSYKDLFCIGLGEKRGLVWTRQRGLHIIITRKLGWDLARRLR